MCTSRVSPVCRCSVYVYLQLSHLPPLYIGIAVDKNGFIYFVDGTMIRKVDRNGIISTLLGSNDLTSARPLTCDTSMHIGQVYIHTHLLYITV